MSKLNDDEILARLKELSNIKPTTESTDRAVQKIRELLLTQQNEPVVTIVSSHKATIIIAIAKFAAAAVIFVGFGFLAGRLSAPKPINMEQLQAALETSLKPSLESAIKQDVLQQLNVDLTNLTSQTLAACRTINDQRFRDTIDLLEAARQRDRQQIETALAQIRQQTTKFGTGLVALAAQTDEILRTQEK
jgi:hypothetical protein